MLFYFQFFFNAKIALLFFIKKQINIGSIFFNAKITKLFFIKKQINIGSICICTCIWQKIEFK
jgi:hypothetical protein